MFNTYSFQEVIVTIRNKAGAILSTKGQGTGSISVNYAADRSAKNVASDGTVVISKLSDRSGSVEMSVQQTSEINKQLMKWFAAVEGDDVSSAEWAGMTITIESKTTGAKKTCTGVAFTKIPDESFSAEAGNVDWSFMCANVSTQPI